VRDFKQSSQDRPFHYPEMLGNSKYNNIKIVNIINKEGITLFVDFSQSQRSIHRRNLQRQELIVDETPSARSSLALDMPNEHHRGIVWTFSLASSLTQLEFTLQPSSRRFFSVDDTVCRVRLWKAIFKNNSLPTIEKDAIEKYYGVLDRPLPKGPQPEKLDQILKRVRKNASGNLE